MAPPVTALFSRDLMLPGMGIAASGLLALATPLVGVIVFALSYIWLMRRSFSVALAVFVLAMPFPLGIHLQHHKFFVSDLMALVLFANLLMESGSKEWRETVRWWFPAEWRWALAALLGLSVLSLGVAVSHSGTLIKILEYIEFFVVLVAAGRRLGRDAAAWRLVFYTLIGIAALIAFAGLYQFLWALGPTSNQIALHHVRADLFFGQPNAFGGFEELVFPFAAALVALGPRGNAYPWMVAGLGGVTLGVVESYSRGAWVGDAAAVALMCAAVWIGQGSKALGRIAAWGIGVPVLGFLVIALLGKTDLTHSHFKVIFQHAQTGRRILSTVGSAFHPKRSYDTAQRLVIWKSALQAIRSHPVLGVGLGNFHVWMAHHRPKGLVGRIPPMAHDIYLEWGADLGVGGIVVALWLEWAWLKAALTRAVGRFSPRDPFWLALAVGALGSVTAFIVHDWVDLLIDHGVIVPLLLALGYLAGGEGRASEAA